MKNEKRGQKKVINRINVLERSRIPDLPASAKRRSVMSKLRKSGHPRGHIRIILHSTSHVEHFSELACSRSVRVAKTQSLVVKKSAGAEPDCAGAAEEAQPIHHPCPQGAHQSGVGSRAAEGVLHHQEHLPIRVLHTDRRGACNPCPDERPSSG